MSRRTLLVPVEIQAREFDAKLLFACFAAERDLDVVVGQRAVIRNTIHKMPVGLYLDKDVAAGRVRIVRIIRGLGYNIASWDEESLVQLSPEHYFKSRVSAITTSYIGRFFAWGDADGEMIVSSPSFQGVPVEVMGNPRADLLRPELRDFFRKQADRLRARYGRFILVNSNFGLLNHIRPKARLVPSQLPEAKLKYYAQMSPPLDYWRFREEMLNHFRHMLPKLAKVFPEHTIILRPHPEENHASWLALTKDCPNVTVTHQGSAVPWLLAAQTVIHNGCTTGLEAFLLNRPVICYSPIRSAEYEMELPDRLSDRAENFEELRALTADFLAGGTPCDPDGEKHALAAHHIASLEGPLASTRILDALERHMAENPLPVVDPANRRAALFKARRRGFEKRILSLIPGYHVNSRSYSRHRFPDITCSQVNRRIARFACVLKRFDGVKAEPMRRNVFKISRGPGP